MQDIKKEEKNTQNKYSLNANSAMNSIGTSITENAIKICASIDWIFEDTNYWIRHMLWRNNIDVHRRLKGCKVLTWSTATWTKRWWKYLNYCAYKNAINKKQTNIRIPKSTSYECENYSTRKIDRAQWIELASS